MTLWKLQEKDGVRRIARQFVTKNFQTALDALNAFGAIAERNGHHPDLHLVNYREVEIVLWTHKVGGLTQNDFELAKVFDSDVEVCYSPKWLNEHPEADRKASAESDA
ncbi:Pterin 4 alpha carbinolamine dehydratase [Fragilaria crotonensis]|nr:Pterin 4 alpha carbinolamine dehydratase [Fragilaria crotonensis]